MLLFLWLLDGDKGILRLGVGPLLRGCEDSKLKRGSHVELEHDGVASAVFSACNTCLFSFAARTSRGTWRA